MRRTCEAFNSGRKMIGNPKARTLKARMRKYCGDSGIGTIGAGIGYLFSRLLRVLNRFPVIPMFLLGLVVAIGQCFEMIITVLALWIRPRFARTVRGEVLQLKTLDDVALA